MNADQKAAERNRQAYLVRAVLAAQNDVAPELLDYIGGTSTEEIDRSIELAKAKSAQLFQRARQAQARPDDVDPAWAANVREGTTATDNALAERVAGMSLLEYSRHRQEFGVTKDVLSFLGGS